jgi:DNA polymerase elongation subunit (family B)
MIQEKPPDVPNFVFQSLDWDFYHVLDADDKKSFVIRIFGKTKDLKTVYLEVTDFKPFFFVEVPANCNNVAMGALMDEVKKNMRIREKNEDDDDVWVDVSENLISIQPVEKCRFWGFTNYKKFKYLQLNFNDFDSMKVCERACNKLYNIPLFKKPIKLKVYESNILPILRFMHIRQLEAVGWISIPENKLKTIRPKNTCCDLNYKTVWTNVNKVDDRSITKFIIAAYDIECDSEDGSFPQPERDKVIQIGVTLSRFGEDDCYEKHLLALHKTSDIDGVNVQWFKTEIELLEAFPELLRKLNPDIITGYNIFGFDFTYLKKRVDALALTMQSHLRKKFVDKFAKMSRISDEISEWKEATLASSALGENILRYYKMTGRVIIDLMKVAQRDYKLSSYKLDSVASYFIREEINKITNNEKDNTFHIITKNTFGLNMDNYISIGYNDGAVEDMYKGGEKFKVVELGKDYIISKGFVDTSEFIKFMGKKGCKVFWSQAKDDIKPADIFRMFKGTSEERAIIGKYCVQDCVLCNKLMTKLQILTNNIGMANVCHVPLSYLFLRGQGVKIFSLVAKKCRERNHLIPVIKKPYKPQDAKPDEKKRNPYKFIDDKDDKGIEKFVNELNRGFKNDEEVNDEEDDGYEGAIVFVPQAGVYFEPIPVLDYASLYPNAMRLRNLSHECFVNDSTYDNLDGYKYHTISYKKNSGEVVTCKFAEKRNGQKGIIPDILTDLLDARKKYKKLMESAGDPFLKSVLDGLQQAYKVTANSLYGQTGASTSPVCMKEIAASTTATGREMLQFSKHFIENIYSQLVNHALVKKSKYDEFFDEVFNYFPTEIDVKDNDDEDIVIHVNTDKNEKIPDSKFKRNSIGYDIQWEKKIPEECNTIYNWKNIIDRLLLISPEDRIEFYDSLQEYLNKKTGDMYIPFKNIWTDFQSKSELNNNVLIPMYNLNKDIKKTFLNYIQIAIDDIGYTNKNHLKEKFYITMNEILKGHNINAKIIYGDSVVGKTPLLLRDSDGNIVIKTISSLGKSWSEYDMINSGKLHDPNIDYEVWTENGWTKIKRVIKHLTNKKIFEVCTLTGCVQVTEDHSLLDKNGNSITPNNCIKTTELLHSFPNRPKECHENLPKLCAFEYNDQLSAMKAYYALKMKGYDIYVKKHLNKYIIGMIDELPEDISRTQIIEISHIPYYDEQYVYDLETDNHHFHAGVGELIVHNTDSVFFCPHIKDLETGEFLKNDKSLCIAIRLGIWASILITTLLPSPMAQEYEKVLFPFIIQGKKRYVGNLYEKNPKEFKQKSMGIELKRRDNAPIVKTVSAGIIDKILNGRDPEGAFEYMKQILKEIIGGKFKMDKFVITKTLKGNALTKDERIKEKLKPKEKRSYVDRTSIVHAVLADRLADRDPGNRPLSNDRIPYAYVELKYEPKLQGERVETPEYILENNLKLDYLFYITNQIMKPALKFLDLITTNSGDLFKDYIMREENRRHNIYPVSHYANTGEECDSEEVFENINATTSKKIKKTKQIVKKKINVSNKKKSNLVVNSLDFF